MSFVVTEISKPVGLTEGRRLQLAARDGKSTSLCIIPEGMGCNATETRWHCAPIFAPSNSPRQSWKLIKNKKGALGTWQVQWDWAARHITVLPPVGRQSALEMAPLP